MKAASQVGFLVLIKLVAFDIVLSSHQSFDAVTIHDKGSTFLQYTVFTEVTSLVFTEQ